MNGGVTAQSIESYKARLRASIERGKRRLAQFEQRYGVDTAHFMQKMTAEDLENGDLEYVEWAEEAKLLKSLKTELAELEGEEVLISSLSDEEVLALSQVQMKPLQGQRLSELLEKQREGALTENERPELLALVQVYEQLWIRQSEALAEAVRRGLRKPLEP